MRRFWLENASGKLWDLTPKNPCDYRSNFFGKPEGLGIKTKITSYEVENTFFIEEVETEAQTITGKLYFCDYEQFKRFVAFVGNINSNIPMKLYYSTENISYNNKLDKQWYKLVLINELKKGEIDSKTGFLICDVKLACLSRWKKDKNITLELTRFGDPLVYPYLYPYIYGGSDTFAVEIDNEDNLPTSCRLTVEGETDSPHFRLLVNNELVEQAKYNIIIRDNQRLIVDSSADHQEATLYTTMEDESIQSEDVYYTGEKDYSYSNFITIPSGKSVLLVSANNADFGRVTISYSLQRELV